MNFFDGFWLRKNKNLLSNKEIRVATIYWEYPSSVVLNFSDRRRFKDKKMLSNWIKINIAQTISHLYIKPYKLGSRCKDWQFSSLLSEFSRTCNLNTLIFIIDHQISESFIEIVLNVFQLLRQFLFYIHFQPIQTQIKTF